MTDKPITERDVARLFEGLIDDWDEFHRIQDAIKNDPLMGTMAKLFGGVSHSLPDLTNTRLYRLVNPPHGAETPHGEVHSTIVEYCDSNGFQSFELKMTRQSQKWELDAEWPIRTEPISMVLTQFDLSHGRTPFFADVELPDNRVTKQILPLGGTYQRLPTGKAQHANKPAIGSRMKPSSRRGNTESFHARFESDATTDFYVRAKNPSERYGDFIVVELTFGPSADVIRHIVELDRARDSPWAEDLVDDFPWPQGPGCRGKLKIRALEHSDLPLLDNRLVSKLLSRETRFAASAVQRDDAGRLNCHLHYPSEQKFASDPATAWFLRVEQKEVNDER